LLKEWYPALKLKFPPLTKKTLQKCFPFVRALLEARSEANFWHQYVHQGPLMQITPECADRALRKTVKIGFYGLWLIFSTSPGQNAEISGAIIHSKQKATFVG
jgi:hypothetical protein